MEVEKGQGGHGGPGPLDMERRVVPPFLGRWPSALPPARSGPGPLLSGRHTRVGPGHVNQAFILFFSPKVQLCSCPSRGF